MVAKPPKAWLPVQDYLSGPNEGQVLPSPPWEKTPLIAWWDWLLTQPPAPSWPLTVHPDCDGDAQSPSLLAWSGPGTEPVKTFLLVSGQELCQLVQSRRARESPDCWVLKRSQNSVGMSQSKQAGPHFFTFCSEKPQNREVEEGGLIQPQWPITYKWGNGALEKENDILVGAEHDQN